MKIYHQSAFSPWPIQDKSVQAVITSPPYYGLRMYDIPEIKIGNWDGHYGLESNPREYIEHTILWIKEAWRVLKDDGIFFLNLGDSYSGSSKGKWKGRKATPGKLGICSENLPLEKFDYSDFQRKCKLLIPHRIAIALIDEGWILRNDIVWTKENIMPESTKDRFSKKFEYIFMFVKNEKYFFDLESIRVPNKNPKDNIRRILKQDTYKNKLKEDGIKNFSHKNISDIKNRIFKGKNPGDIWTINNQPSKEKHFAMWPEQLVRRMILCSSQEGDIIFDPFCGSGTTIKVSEQLNRNGIGIDLGYKDIQERKLKNIQKEFNF